MPSPSPLVRRYPNLQKKGAEEFLYWKQIYDFMYDTKDAQAEIKSQIAGVSKQVSSVHPSSIRQMVQANGPAPLNVSGLPGRLAAPQVPFIQNYTAAPALGSTGAQVGALIAINNQLFRSTGTGFVALESIAEVLQDTHTNRITAPQYNPAGLTVGTVFIETDRHYLYTVETVAGSHAWVFQLGEYLDVLANQPVGLGVNDTDALFTATDTFHRFYWTGSAWVDITFIPTSGTTLNLAERGVSTTYLVVEATDFFILANATVSGFTVTLPNAPTGNPIFVIKKSDATVNVVTVVGSGGTLIDNQASIGLSSQNDSIMVQWDGSNWWILADARTISTPAWSAYTPGVIPNGGMTWVGSSTVANFLQTGKNVYVRVDLFGTIGGTPGNSFDVTLPATAKIINQCMSAVMGLTGLPVQAGYCFIDTVNTVNIGKYDGSNFPLGANQTLIFEGVYEGV